jgi:hypothetical protein
MTALNNVGLAAAIAATTIGLGAGLAPASAARRNPERISTFFPTPPIPRTTG